MLLASAGDIFNTVAENLLWVVILGGIATFLFIGWLFKLENNREQRQRKKPHNARYDGGKRRK